MIQPTIASFLQPGTPPSCPLRVFLRRHSYPQVICLQEVKVSPTDLKTQRVLERVVDGSKDDGPAYTVHLSLPRDKHNARGFGGKLYGVATLIREDFSTSAEINCEATNWDLEGRVLVACSTTLHLAILNIYAVNGTENIYRDPETGDICGTRHDHKRRFHHRLLDECLRLESAGFSVVIAGDMNISRSTIDGHPRIRTANQHIANREDFNRKFFDARDGLRGVDVFRYLHGDERRYTYYSRGREWGSSCDRVDLIICSKELVEGKKALVRAQILNSELERGPSDHVPLFVALDQRKLIEVDDKPPLEQHETQ